MIQQLGNVGWKGLDISSFAWAPSCGLHGPPATLSLEAEWLEAGTTRIIRLQGSDRPLA